MLELHTVTKTQDRRDLVFDARDISNLCRGTSDAGEMGIPETHRAEAGKVGLWETMLGAPIDGKLRSLIHSFLPSASSSVHEVQKAGVCLAGAGAMCDTGSVVRNIQPTSVLQETQLMSSSSDGSCNAHTRGELRGASPHRDESPHRGESPHQSRDRSPLNTLSTRTSWGSMDTAPTGADDTTSRPSGCWIQRDSSPAGSFTQRPVLAEQQHTRWLQVCTKCCDPIKGSVFMLRDLPYCSQRHRLEAYQQTEEFEVKPQSDHDEQVAQKCDTGLRQAYGTWV